MNRSAMRILLHGLKQNFFGLGVAAISHINIGFRHRIYFIGINRSRAGLTEISRLRRRPAGIHTLAARVTEYRVGTETGLQRLG
ncbi:MAG TPA: hypothetical protein PLW86_06980, partial [Rhodocyclaceae bacterium]|nr:hypothetical protein [Rhodocyclaceae bacterium]